MAVTCSARFTHSLCFALLLGAMDSSIVATALVSIGAQFDDFRRLQWVVLAYLLVDLGAFHSPPALRRQGTMRRSNISAISISRGIKGVIIMV